MADAPPASLRRRARLPVRVIFTLDAERADAALERLVEEVRCWPGSLDIERRADSVGVTVAPDDLLTLVTLQRPHEHIIRTMRVLEPALHDVYDELMRVSEDDLLASVAAASGGKG